MKKVSLLILVAIMAVGLAGCIKIQSQQAAVSSSVGVFVSGDRGDTWLQRVKLMTPGAIDANIPGGQILNITMDPTDTDAMYVGTRNDGLYYSYNGGDGWTKAVKLSKVAPGRVLSVAIDPKDKCSIYAGVENRVVKSSDCNRTWEAKFNTPRGDLVINSLAIDWSNTAVVYAGSSNGTIFKSTNAGASWINLYNLNKNVKKLIVDPNDSQVLYALLEQGGIQRSLDGGASWISLNDNMKDFVGNTNEGFGLEMVKGSPNVLYYLSRFGLLRSLDSGASWSQVKLLTDIDSTAFNAFAVAPNNSNYLFIADDKTVYRSLNGGQTWETRVLPSTSRITDMKVHLANDKILYIGFKEVEK